jgi:hypothetical protein
MRQVPGRSTSRPQQPPSPLPAGRDKGGSVTISLNDRLYRQRQLPDSICSCHTTRSTAQDEFHAIANNTACNFNAAWCGFAVQSSPAVPPITAGGLGADVVFCASDEPGYAQCD